MSNYFYHPLGNYAENYVNGSADTSALPHTYAAHGYSKIDFGVGGGHKVYSMTDGTIMRAGFLGASDKVSKYGCVVKTSDCGYSRMQAKLLGGTAEDYPIFFTYIELDALNPNLKAGNSITKGTWIGDTNDDYAGSNLHFDIQPYDRYGSEEGTRPDKLVNAIMGGISLDRIDAYGDKGANYNLKEHLDDNFKIDGTGIKDHAGKYIGVKGDDGRYYPPSSGGYPIKDYIPDDNKVASLGNLEIWRWYSYMFMMQTPFKIEGKGFGSMSAGWYPSNDMSSTGIEGYFSTGTYTYPVFSQCRGPWARIPFWDGTFSSDACNISALASICSGLTGNMITPVDVKEAAYNWSGSTDANMNHGRGQHIINNLPTIMTLFGVNSRSVYSAGEAKAHLLSGKPVEVNVSGYYGAGTTSAGHLISFLAYDENTNKVFIGDPAGRKGSGWYPWSDATATSFWYILAE